jgi:hypothetical protein
MDDLDPTVIADLNDSVADGSITTNQLSEQILKYLKPEITQQPTAGTIYADTNGTISVSAEGKYLTYQWKKNGVNLAGETNATLKITDANATQHEGNYSVVVSNDFGSVESGLASIVVPGYNLTDGLVAWWKFDGNTNDSSGNNLNGSNQGASLTTDKNGESGKAYSFNNSHISVAHSNLLNFTDSFSISLWVFSTNYISNDWQEFLMKGSTNYTYRQYHMRPDKNTGRLQFIFYQSGTSFSSTSNTALENNKWSHVVGTLSNSQVNLYINGLNDSSRQFNNFSSVTSTSYGLSIGRLGTGGYYFNGKIDEVRMYDRALSALDVQALYQLGQ